MIKVRGVYPKQVNTQTLLLF
jgi:hypothetical protein